MVDIDETDHNSTTDDRGLKSADFNPRSAIRNVWRFVRTYASSAPAGALTPVAKLYIAGVCLAGLFVLLQPPTFPMDDPAGFVAFFILCGLGQMLPIKFFNRSSISLSMAMAMAAIFLFGPMYAVGVNLASGLVHLATGIRKRRPIYRSAVTIAILVLTAWTAGRLYVALGGPVGLGSDYFHFVLPGAVAGWAYYLINTSLITAAMALEQRQSFRVFWGKNYQWLSLNFARMSLLAFAVAVFYQKMGFAGLGLFLLPIFIAWYSTRLYERTVEDVNTANAELKVAHERLNIMYEVSRSLVGSLHLDETLERIVAAAGLIGFPISFVASPASAQPGTRGHSQLKIGYGHGVDPAHLEWVHQLIAVVCNEPSFLAGEPSVISDFNLQSEINNLKSDVLTLVPLFNRGELWGVVGVGSADLPSPIVMKELLILRPLAERAIEMALDHEQAQRDALIDARTGLYNHRYFQEALQRELADAYRRNSFLSFLMIDINNFKEFNDVYGHLVGDQVLQVVAQVLRENVREGDIACRYGGDEMCVLLPHTDRARAIEVASRIDGAIRAYPFHIRQETGAGEAPSADPSLRVSIGVATFPEAAHTRAGLVEQADRACYRAKALGGGVAAEGGRQEANGNPVRLQLVKSGGAPYYGAMDKVKSMR